MKFVEDDTFLCPLCGCMFKREESNTKIEFKDSISKRNDVECPNCGEIGMCYQSKGISNHIMVGYRLQDTMR